MARDNYLSLPLSIDLSAWEQSLTAADADLQKAMRQMRASMKDLRMRYDVEIAGAKLAGDDLKALETETEKLNRLYIEQERVVNALNRAYQQSVQEKGASAQATQALAQQMIREAKELDKLKNQLQARTPVVDTSAQERAAQAQARLQKELRDINATAYQREVNALSDKVNAYIKAGAREVDAHRLFTEEKLKIDQKYAEQARQAQERAAQEQAKQQQKLAQEYEREFQERQKQAQREAQEKQRQTQEQAKEAQRQADEQRRQSEQTQAQQNRARENIISGALQMVSPRLEGARRTISGLIESFGALGGKASKVGSAIGSVISNFGPAVVSIGAIVTAVKLMKTALDDARSSLLRASEATSKLMEHLSDLADTTQLPIDEVMKLSTACKIAGADIDTIAPALNRLNKAVLGGDKTLEKFGINLKDTSGGLKSTTEQLEELANAYSRMKAEGRGGEFVAELGKNAQALLPFISRLADADFNNVKKLLDSAPKVATMLEDDAKYIGELDRALEVLNGRLSNAQGAEAAQLKIENLLHSIENAKDELQALQDTAASRKFEISGISALDDEMHKFDKSIISAKASLNALIADLSGSATMRIAYGLDSIKKLMQGDSSFLHEDFDDYAVRKNLEYQERLNKRDNERIKALLGELETTKTNEDAFKKIRERIEREHPYADAELRERLYTAEVQKYTEQRAASRRREAELAEQTTAELKKQLRDLTATEEERKINSINDRYENNAKKDVALAEKIRQTELKKLAEESTKKRAELERKLTDVTLSEQEKRIEAINREYEANAKVDVALADRIRQAELKRIEDETTKARIDAMDKIRTVMQSDFQNRLDQIEKEKQAWIKAGADRVAVEQATQKQITDLYKQQSQERMSEAERLLTEQKQIIKDIQKGLSDSEIMERADKRFMKNRGFNRSMIDTLDEVGFERINKLADARQRLLGRFGMSQQQTMSDAIGFGKQQIPQAPQVQQVPNLQVVLNFDNTVVEDMSSMQKIADKVAGVIQPAIEKALRGESSYGY